MDIQLHIVEEIKTYPQQDKNCCSSLRTIKRSLVEELNTIWREPLKCLGSLCFI